MSRVSIIIPCYNRAPFIRQAVESALSQNYAAEILVIDDGSVDESWSIIQSFGDSVIACKQNNHGVSSARNNGIIKASGDYIRFLDSDDILPKNAISEILYYAMEKSAPYDIIFGDASIIDSKGKPGYGPRYGFPDLESGTYLELGELLSCTMSPILPLFPKKSLIDVGLFNTSMNIGEDQEIAIRLVKHGYKFKKLKTHTALVREHSSDRLSRSGGGERYKNLLILYKEIAKNLVQMNASQEEKSSFGRSIWITGRDASRDGFIEQAVNLFRMGRYYGGHKSQGLVFTNLYRFISPYYTERLLSMLKNKS